MIFQVVLVAILIILIVGFLRSRGASRTKAYKKIFLVLFVIAAIIIAIFPGVTTYAAHFLGIGRGADLLLYGVTVVVIFMLLNGYVKDRDEEKRLVELSRKVAILEALLHSKK